MSKYYGSDFYAGQKVGSLKSAEIVIPLILNLIKPKSVIDVGCGVGTWLSVFKKNGIQDVLGLDGDYVDKNLLEIKPDEFRATNVAHPIEIGRVFDLAISLEVAEHIAQEAADTFIESLIKMAPVVVFSAAIPHQRGANHVNEQWPDYWREKFSKHNYVAIDCIRARVWDNEDVKVWYRQNTIIYVLEDFLEKNPALKAEFFRNSGNQLSMVHPIYYLNSAQLSFEKPTKALRLFLWDKFVEYIKTRLSEKNFNRLKKIKRLSS